MTFNVGDKVTYKIRFPDEPVRHGEVVETYDGHKNPYGQRECFYAVRWSDTNNVERGHLGFALTPEPLVVA